MQSNVNGMGEEFQKPLGELLALRKFTGTPKDFWPRFLAASAQLASADAMVLILGSPDKKPRWTKIGEWTAGAGQPRLRTGFFSQLESAAERCLNEGSFISEEDEAGGAFTVAIRLKLTRAGDEVMVVGLLTDFTEPAARESLLRLGLGADTPELYQSNLSVHQAKADVEKFATVLDLMVPINAEKHFLSAAMALCNGVATSLKCDRVSLGWLENGYIKLQAISRTESFDKRMAAAQGLEAAMEECLDQDEEIIWPAPAGAARTTTVRRDHGKYATEQKVGLLCSLPLRADEDPVAVLMCERCEPHGQLCEPHGQLCEPHGQLCEPHGQLRPFTTVEVQQIRLCCDQAVRRLADLKQSDRWFGARWMSGMRELLAKFLSPEHTLAKALGILIALCLVALFLVRVEYRVEGPFMLRSDEVSFLTAPFDGYIEEVAVRPGDRLPKGGRLLSLDRSELFLEESAAKADLSRYQRESEKARAAKSLAEMKISDALAEQARAKLDLVQYRLENAVIKSPFEGVVVEGDLRERIAAPVKQGDALYKVAKTDALYVEAEINERDVKQIVDSSKGEVAFVTQPKLKFPATLLIVQPAAVTRKEGNVFLVRLRFNERAHPWWRPGMTGLCKVSAGQRSLFWILTHRTVDFLRMKLWW